MAVAIINPDGDADLRGYGMANLEHDVPVTADTMFQSYTHQEWVSPYLNTTADGSLLLSARDMAQWESGLRAGTLLKEASWKEITKPAPLSGGSSYPYGFGWMLDREDGRNTWYHSGSWQGFQVYFIRWVDSGHAIAVFANSGGADPERIAHGIAGLLGANLPVPDER